MKSMLVRLALPIVLSISQLYASNKIPFERLNSDEGLSLVKDIYRDTNSFLWLATGGFGLIRYDSYEMKSYSHRSDDSDNTLLDNITKLYEDSHGLFWIASYGGLDRFDRETETFTEYIRPEYDSSDFTTTRVNDMVEDAKGDLWIASGNGLYRYNRQLDTFLLCTRAKIPGGRSNFQSLAIDAGGNLWLSTYADIIYCFHPSTGELEPHPLRINTGQTIHSMKLFIDADQYIWIALERYGVAIYHPETKKTTYITQKDNSTGLNNNTIMDIEEFTPGLIYLATDQGGINIYNKKSGTFSYISSKNKNAGNLTSDGIYCLYQDTEHILWIGTSRGGVNYYNPKKYRFNNLFEENNVRHYYSLNASITHGIVGNFFEDSKGLIWIGTNGGGINIFDRATGSIRELSTKNTGLPNDIVSSISEDSQGTIWITCWPDVITRYLPDENRFVPYHPKLEKPIHNVHDIEWSVMIDQKDRVWINYAEGHIAIFDKTGKELTRREVSPDPQHYFSRSTYINNLNSYFSVVPDGIVRLDEETLSFKTYIEKKRVVCFSRDNRGNFWVGTLEDGLFEYDPAGQQMAHYSTENGLSNNTIYSIECSPTGTVWIATNNGLNELNPATSQIFQYFESDGLQSNQYFIQSSLRTRDGQLYFGGLEGVDFFYPQKIKRNDFLPKSHLIKVEVIDNNGMVQNITSQSFGKSSKDQLHLSWKENMLVFNFFAINYTYQEKTLYKYCLLGSEPDEWIETPSRQATYTNLKPGTYTFKVIACNNDAVWNTQGDEFSFIIDAPFWQRTWFYAICLFFLIVCFYMAIRLRSRVLLRDKEILKQRVAERTMVIEEQKSKLLQNQAELELHRDKLEDLVQERTIELEAARIKAENSDRLKSAFLANMSHEIRTPMNAIVGFATLLDDPNFSDSEHTSFVKTIIANSNVLLVLIEDILDFSLIEANQLPISIKTFNLTDIIHDVYNSQAINLIDKPVSMSVEHQDAIPSLIVNSDPGRIRQILNNLVNNAIKFTEQGFIKIGTQITEGQLRIYVQDTGIGIEENQLENIFGRFVKLDQTQTTIRGLGLGLSISKRIANMLGGDIQVESKPGQGSTFSLVLPDSLLLKQELPKKEQTPTHKRFEWKNKHILIVEDERDNYNFLINILKKSHIHIQIAEDGQEAVDLFKKGASYDLVLMDIKMPRLNGYEAMKIIREIKPDQLVIAQTAYAQPKDQYKIMENGFNDYLSKPISPNYLYEVLGKYLH